MLHAAIAQRQFAPAAAATDQAGEQGVAMFGRAVMSAGWNIAGDHRADRFEPLPAHIAVVGAGLQREPVGARFAADLHTGAPGAVSHRHSRSTIGIGAAVDRVLDHPVESGVIGPSPGRLAVPCFTGRSRFRSWNQSNACRALPSSSILLKTSTIAACTRRSRILLISVVGLHEADRSRYDEFAAPGLRITGGKRALAEKIEFVFVEAPFEPEQQTIIAVPRRVDRFLIDEHRVTTRHISISCCQSRLLRAKRETSRAQTAPTLPRQTSATIRSKPARCTLPAAERPRSSSITLISVKPRAVSRSRMAYWNAPLSRLCSTWWVDDWRT